MTITVRSATSGKNACKGISLLTSTKNQTPSVRGRGFFQYDGGNLNSAACQNCLYILCTTTILLRITNTSSAIEPGIECSRFVLTRK